MGIVHINQIISFEISGLFTASKAEKYYDTVIKDSLAFICTHPQYVVSLCFTGELLAWIEQFHSEVFMILEELTRNRQIECISSGYNNPLFPLLLPVDRTGQIDKQTTLLRKITGKRSRGLKLALDCWDQSLISSLKTAGVEYVLIQNELFIKNSQKQLAGYRPHLVEDCGKTLILVPYIRQTDILEQIQNSYHQLISQPYDTIFTQLLTGDEFIRFIQTNAGEKLYDWSSGQPLVELSTPSIVTRFTAGFLKTTIPAVWNGTSHHVRELINQNQSIQQLYARMMQVSTDVNQYRGDKVRKRAAREDLWKAQDYKMYCGNAKCGAEDAAELFALQQVAYRHLLAAEKIMENPSEKTQGSINCYDFDFDGLNEYVCRFSEYNAFVRLQGGALFELDSRNSFQLYTLCSGGEVSQNQRTVFNDFLLDEDSFTAFRNSEYPYTRSSHDIHFEEQSFRRSKREIIFLGTGIFGKKRQPFSLKKRYVFSDNGVQVTYILKNESPMEMKGHFLVENTLAVPYQEADKRTIDVITNDSKIQTATDQEVWRDGDISLVQLTDKVTEMSFVFQTNENASLKIQPLYIGSVCAATNCGFFWGFDLPPQYTTEKTLFLTIKTPGKNSLGGKGRRKRS